MRYAILITAFAVVATSTHDPETTSISIQCPTGSKPDPSGVCTPFGAPSSTVCAPGSEPDGHGGCKPFYHTTTTSTSIQCPTGSKPDPSGVCTPFGAPSSTVCAPGSEPDGHGGCKPFYHTTTTPAPYPCGDNITLCTIINTNRTDTITTTTTKIETITFCPTKTSCRGQTVTWTATEGPTSCPPAITCTCVLPGVLETLTTCPPSVTCTGQTTTNPGGSTVVLPSETFPTQSQPTTTSTDLPAIAAKGGLELVAVLLGAAVAL